MCAHAWNHLKVYRCLLTALSTNPPVARSFYVRSFQLFFIISPILIDKHLGKCNITVQCQEIKHAPVGDNEGFVHLSTILQ